MIRYTLEMDISISTLELLTKLDNALLANQSLKLTEHAVDDFAARCWTDLSHLIGTSAQRATWRRLFVAAA